MLEVVSFDMVGTLPDSSFEDHVWNTMIPQLYARKRGIYYGKPWPLRFNNKGSHT